MQKSRFSKRLEEVRQLTPLEVGAGQRLTVHRQQRPSPTRGTSSTDRSNFKTSTSLVPCTRGGWIVSLLFVLDRGLDYMAERGSSTVGGKYCLAPRWVLVVSFVPFRTATVKLRGHAKIGYACPPCSLFARFWPPTVVAARS